MIQQRLYEWIKHPERLDRESLYELRSLLARYPYFQTARLLYLKNLFLLHDITFGEELRRTALYIADRRILFSLVEGERYTWKALEKQQAPEETAGVDRTLSLIDAFLSTLPEEPTASSFVSLPVEAATDYTSYLMKESPIGEETAGQEEPRMKGQDLIDSFLENSEEQPLISSVVEEEEEILDKTEEETEDESYFTETLAKIYVKQRKDPNAIKFLAEKYSGEDKVREAAKTLCEYAIKQSA